MKTARRISQLCFFIFFLILFFQTNRHINWADGSMDVSAWAPADFFLRIDPLLGWTSLLSSGSFLLPIVLWTLPVLVLTLLFSRVFCGWICPLGTCIDGADKLVRHKKQRRTDREISRPRLKYYILAGLFITALFGSQLVWIMDPIALLVRSFTLGILGPLHWGAQFLSGVPPMGWMFDRARGLFPERQAVYGSGFVALLMFAGILAGGFLARRFWCRSLCPLGALMGIIGRFPLFRRRVTSECTECMVCGIDCKMDAIGEKGKNTNRSECIFCYSCVNKCRQDAIRMLSTDRSKSLPLDINRRRLLTGIGAGAIWGISAKAAITTRSTRDGSAHITDTRLIRPPGSVAESLFTERCARCGACMKICPTNGLQPALAEGGLAGIWTPVLAPRIGECSQNCNLCGQVCPTAAIAPFALSEKEHLFIGRALIDRSSCIVWESNKQCLVCDEVCSYSAIYWLDESGKDVLLKKVQGADGETVQIGKGLPYVDPARCVGCGICEYNCPVGGPNAAIRVTCEGDKRHLSRKEQKAWQKDNWVDREGKPSLIRERV
jgi:polyferredoxin